MTKKSQYVEIVSVSHRENYNNNHGFVWGTKWIVQGLDVIEWKPFYFIVSNLYIYKESSSRRIFVFYRKYLIRVLILEVYKLYLFHNYTVKFISKNIFYDVI